MAYEVLFVCTGNVCRSPAAERLFRRAVDGSAGGIAGLSGVTVSSAGTNALVGEPISPPMAELLVGEGVDVDGFVARQLNAEVVRNASLIITMTSAHRGDTVAMLPAAVQRTFVLGELAQMLSRVGEREVTLIAGPNASSAERLRALVTVAKRNRTPGVDPDEDIVDPYGRSKSVYADSYDQIRAALEPITRLTVLDARPT